MESVISQEHSSVGPEPIKHDETSSASLKPAPIVENMQKKDVEFPKDFMDAIANPAKVKSVKTKTTTQKSAKKSSTTSTTSTRKKSSVSVDINKDEKIKRENQDGRTVAEKIELLAEIQRISENGKKFPIPNYTVENALLKDLEYLHEKVMRESRIEQGAKFLKFMVCKGAWAIETFDNIFQGPFHKELQGWNQSIEYDMNHTYTEMYDETFRKLIMKYKFSTSDLPPEIMLCGLILLSAFTHVSAKTDIANKMAGSLFNSMFTPPQHSQQPKTPSYSPFNNNGNVQEESVTEDEGISKIQLNDPDTYVNQEEIFKMMQRNKTKEVEERLPPPRNIQTSMMPDTTQLSSSEEDIPKTIVAGTTRGGPSKRGVKRGRGRGAKIN